MFAKILAAVAALAMALAGSALPICAAADLNPAPAIVANPFCAAAPAAQQDRAEKGLVGRVRDRLCPDGKCLPDRRPFKIEVDKNETVHVDPIEIKVPEMDRTPPPAPKPDNTAAYYATLLAVAVGAGLVAVGAKFVHRVRS